MRPRGELVGRDTEREALARLLDDTMQGMAGAVFVEGEPGIGKSALLAELARQAEVRHFLVLDGGAAEFEQELPFGVVIDALDSYLQSLGVPAVDRLRADGFTQLADIFPSLRVLRPAVDVPAAAADRYRSYHAVRQLLERLAGGQPLVLVLDDLHWADGATLELVAHLLRRPPDAPVLLAAAFRPAQAGPALLAAVAAGDAKRLNLAPLNEPDAARLLATADESARARLYVQSGGNPFYLLQLSRQGSGDDRNAPAGAPAGDGTVPRAVVAAIVGEVRALSSAGRALAEAAAVVGDPFELDMAAAAAGVAEPEALVALDELLARDLVRPAPVPRWFTFRHPLVRSAVYEAAAFSSRIACHARCDAALAERGVSATTRAFHVEQSARHGDGNAVGVLVDAGRATARRLPSSAVRWFDAALRLLPENAPAEERVGLIVEHADALTTAGRLADARASLVRGIELAAAGPVDLRLRLTAACAGAEQQLGLHPEAHSRLVAALHELTDRSSGHAVALMIALASDGFHQLRYDDLIQWGGAAVAASTVLGDRALRAAAEAVLAMGCAFIGATAEAQSHADAAAALVDGMTDDEVAVRRDALGNLAVAELVLERFESTATHARRGIALARAVGQDDCFPTLFPCLGTAAWVLGRLGESADVLDDAVESARLTGSPQGTAWALLSRAISALMAGEWDLARSAAEESATLAGGLGDSFVSAHAGVILGWVLAETGDPGRAVDLIVNAGGGEDLPRLTGGWRAGQHEVLTRCWLALGRPDEARKAATRAREVADQVGLPRSAALAHLAAAAVALDGGDAAAAVDEARAAVTSAEAASAVYDVATARIMLGRSLAARGDTASAVSELSLAADAFDGFGAVRARDRAEQELRRLGHRVHRRSERGAAHGEGVDALSGRELEVARLVVDRRTNAQIAAELFLSLKTVETHMRNIFRKLDVSSRADVARVLERADRRNATGSPAGPR